MRVSSWRGLPTVTLASRSRTASMTASADELGTIARRMAVHFWPALTVISATTPLTNRSNSGSSTLTSGPSTEQFSESASTPSCTPPCITLVCVRSIPAVWAEPVKATESCTVQLVEQAGRAAAQQLERTLGQDAGLDDAADGELGEVGGLRRRLHDGRQAGKEGGCELLEHPPDREVEGVDLDGDAGPRGVDVLADERPAAAELLEVAVGDDRVVRQLAHSLAGEAEHGAEAAVDVDHRVALGRAGAEREVVELVLDAGLGVGEVLGQSLEQAGALVEGQGADRGAADGPRVRRHLAEVEPVAGDAGDLLAGGGVQQRPALVARGVPAAGGVALEHPGHVIRPLVAWSA